MKRLSLLIIVLLAFVQCKKEIREPAPEIASIVGKWRVVENRQVYNDSTVINPVPKVNSYLYEFRYDGVLLNENGYVPCCLPQKYSLNGTGFTPRPIKPAELDPICATTYCVICAELKLTLTAPDSLLFENCPGSYRLFAREK